MPGETDLAILLASLDPALDARQFGYALLPHGASLPSGLVPWAIVHEDEGMTLIAPAAELAAAGLHALAGLARLTMMVHSSLDAVGMTAAMATALSRAGISANVVAAYHHDHIFVPWNRREEAVAVLRELAQGGGTVS